MSARPTSTRCTPLALALAFALAGAAVAALALALIGPDASATPAKVAKLPLMASKGETLSAADSAEVTHTLLDYLGAMKAKDYARASAFLDSASFLTSADSMVARAANDSTPEGAIRASMFGTASRDSLHAWPIARVFTALLTTTEASNPGALDAIARADIEVLAARRVADHLVVAYQLTVPSPTPGGEPFTHVTAEKLRSVSGHWRILFLP